MKRAHVLAAALPAAIGLAMPITAASAAPSGHSKKVSLHPILNNVKLAEVVRPASDIFCSNNSCFSDIGTGLYLSDINDKHWKDVNGGNRVGYVGFYGLSQYNNNSQWKKKSDSVSAGQNLSYHWDPKCFFPKNGNGTWGHIDGHVQGHTFNPNITISNGNQNTPHCAM